MTLWQKFAGALVGPVLAGTVMICTTAPSLAEITATPRRQNVALVEEVRGDVKGVEFMDYVAPGQVIKLGPQGSVVLTYMVSCWRETITGGTVVVGMEESLFHLSKVEGAKVDCHRDGQPVSDQQHEAAATVFRGMSRPLSTRYFDRTQQVRASSGPPKGESMARRAGALRATMRAAIVMHAQDRSRHFPFPFSHPFRGRHATAGYRIAAH